MESDPHLEQALELARQLLPLGTWREVARDGLLCIAGIQGIAAGAVLWRGDGNGALQLLSQFGLGAGRLRLRYRLSTAAQAFLLESGPLTLDAARRRPAGRALLAALRPLDAQLGDAWLFPWHAEGQLRGLLCAGPSLVTQELAPPSAIAAIVDLGELLRLRLLGCAAESPAPDHTPTAEPRAAAVPASARSVASRLRLLRRNHAETAEIVGESPAVLALLEEIVSLADTDYTVLVEGETGTGKELAAHLLHRLSRRATGPFEAVDCSSIPQELIESELFGHVKGAFTGATRDFRGAFERADGGTLLLDEIGDMDFRSQTRLLRVLQEGQVRRLGGDRPVPVNVRVVAATNRDLVELVRERRFRDDLYYRIHVCALRVPALRERGDDRQVLFDFFMAQHAATLKRPSRPLTPAARRRLRDHPFPGNIRQLQNVVRQILVQRGARGAVAPEELEKLLLRAASMVRPLPPRRAESSEGRGEDSAAATETPAAAAEPRAVATRPVAAGSVVPTPLPGAGSTVVDDVGEWVLQRLREHRFNLAAAARALQDQRRGGVPRTVIPVFDRGALDYYLCGEFFRALAARGYDVDAAVGALAARPHHVPRLRRKVRAYARPLRSVSRLQGAAARARLHEIYRRVPEGYRGEIEAAAAALRRGRWRIPT